MEPFEMSSLEEILGHRFQTSELLQQALTHSSFAREAESQTAPASLPVRYEDNEQLEFLGDAVLSFVVSQELFRRFPQYHEGDLSKLRAYVVSARHLLRPARQLQIGQYLRLGRGEDKSGGRTKSALLVNALEAIIAALFLDGGLPQVHRFIVEKILEPELAELHKQGKDLPITDYKSALQEMVHAAGRPQPRYVTVKEEGPEHRKRFTIEAQVPAASAGGEPLVSHGEGSTKKRAEQRAARQALEYLQSLEKQPAANNGGGSGESSSSHE